MSLTAAQYKSCFEAKQLRALATGHGLLLKTASAEEMYAWTEELEREIEAGIIKPCE